jgi:hypothetical protein
MDELNTKEANAPASPAANTHTMGLKRTEPASVWRSRWGVYALAVVIAAATLLGRLALASWTGDRPVLILFVIPIILSAYVGGLGPGLVCTVLVAFDLAHDLGLKVVAEGVENADTWDRLVALGCDAGQGYYMSRPLPAPEITRWLSESQWGLGRSTPPMMLHEDLQSKEW